jgi:peroxiredoxin
MFVLSHGVDPTKAKTTNLVSFIMPFCPYCGSGCDTMSGLSRHLSQHASCAFALSKDPKHSKKRAASAKSQSFNYDIGDEHNLNLISIPRIATLSLSQQL